jgi:tRNA (guanine-N7-)-methyltransferase
LRLRRKPWINERIADFADICYYEEEQIAGLKGGNWEAVFDRPAPLHVELGSGKGKFITQTALKHPEINYLAIEAQKDVAYYIAVKARELGLKNIRILVFDINNIADIFAPYEVDRFYINFCDPWPKSRHAKRRLTHQSFLQKYRGILKAGGDIHFKTDNRPLFDFSLEQFAAENLKVKNLTFDLHADNMEDNIMTEYEAKFSALGSKINRCELQFQ